jgi:ParB family chromosome partitioning protein
MAKAQTHGRFTLDTTIRTDIITYLAVTDIAPHPDNPRKDLGDLTELADSIKARGIMQNLTVIPAVDDSGTGGYTVIIGYRRLAAAKLAGLSEVPCVIVPEMTASEQISVMLHENMQRADLTLVEQGESFQMLIDLGETTKTLSEQYGFSEATIKRRVKLVTTFGGDKLREVQHKQIDLADYEKLYKIEDEKERDKLFNKIGTREFDWSVTSVLDTQKKKKRRVQITEILSGFAKSVSNAEWQKAAVKTSKWISYSIDEDFKYIKELAKTFDTDEHYYFTTDDYNMRLYTSDGVNATGAKTETNEEKARKKRISELKELFKQAHTRRFEFVKNFKITSKAVDIIDKMAIDAMLTNYALDNPLLQKFYGVSKFRYTHQSREEVDADTREEFTDKLLEENISNSTLLLASAYFRFDEADSKCTNYSGSKYEKNKQLFKLYSYLEKLGYEISDTEAALLDGTHELYETASESEDYDEDDNEYDDPRVVDEEDE